MNNRQMIQLLSSNPQQFVQQMLGNPQVANNKTAMNALELIKNGDNKNLEKMARNMCRENGTTPDTVKQDILSQIGLM